MQPDYPSFLDIACLALAIVSPADDTALTPPGKETRAL